MSPRIVDKDQKRRDIARAALAVIADRGFEGTSISQIAEAAGVSKGTVYLYFDSKEELIVTAARDWVASIGAAISPVVDEAKSPLARLRDLLAASTCAFIENPKIVMLFLGVTQVFLREPKLLEQFSVAREVSAPIRRAIIDILVDGVAAGVFCPETQDRAESIAINLVAFVDGIGLHYVTGPSDFDLTEQIDLYLNTQVRSLMVDPSWE